MAIREFHVDRMQRVEQPSVVASLSRAFYDDPMFNFFVPHHVRQIGLLLNFMGAGVADARTFDEVWVAHIDGKVAGAAVWLPPGAYPRNGRREAMTYIRTLPTFGRVGRRAGASIRLLNELDKVHQEITEPHFYLAIFGTDPLYQRSGAGTAMLRPVLDRCDEHGLLAYLETQKEENLAYYARHAFDVVREVEAKGCPPIWTLLRRPR